MEREHTVENISSLPNQTAAWPYILFPSINLFFLSYTVCLSQVFPMHALQQKLHTLGKPTRSDVFDYSQTPKAH